MAGPARSDLRHERVPGGTALFKLRRLLEKHQLGERLFFSVLHALRDRGLRVGIGCLFSAALAHVAPLCANTGKHRTRFQPIRSEGRAGAKDGDLASSFSDSREFDPSQFRCASGLANRRTSVLPESEASIRSHHGFWCCRTSDSQHRSALSGPDR